MNNIKTKLSEFINENVVNDSMEVKKLYDDDVDGFYLIKTGHLPVTKEKRMRPSTFGQVHDEFPVIDVDKGEFVMYDSDSDKPLHKYLEDLIGPWNIQNAEDWSDYTVLARGEQAEDGYEELYSW